MLRRVLARCAGTVFAVVQYGCIAHCTLEFVGDFAVCSGPSMWPTIRENDIVLTEHISVNTRAIKPGDIVIVRSPTNPHQHICKRVRALEGDHVRNRSPTLEYTYVPRGHVWLEGDNADNSSDSRSYGPVPYGLIRSRVFYKVWPVYDMQRLSSQEDNTDNRS